MEASWHRACRRESHPFHPHAILPMNHSVTIAAAPPSAAGRAVTLALPILRVLFFFLLPILLFWPVLWGDATLIPFDNLYEGLPWHAYQEQLGIGAPHNELVSDLVLENFQWKQFAVAQLRQGELPLWQNLQFAGSPFLATGQHSMLYPLSWLFLVLPIHLAFGWFTVLSLAVAGMTMYLFARVLGLRPASAMLAGLIYQGSGFFTISVVFPMIIAGAAWLPLLLAALHQLGHWARETSTGKTTLPAPHKVRRPKAEGGTLGMKDDTANAWPVHPSSFILHPSSFIPWMATGAVAIGLAGLAGHPEIFYYTLLVGGLYALWQLRTFVRRPRAAFRFIALGTLTLLIGLLLSAAQLVPLYETVTHNFREGSAELEEVLGYAWPLRQASSFVVPDLLGNPARHDFYNLETRQWEPIVTQQPINAEGDTTSLDHVAWFKGTPDWKNYVEGAGYLGILPLLLATVALWTFVAQRTKSREDNLQSPISTPHSALRTPHLTHSAFRTPHSATSFFSILALVSLLFIFGSPLYGLLFHTLPGFSQLHTPFRWVWPLTLAISMLAGIGWEALRARSVPSHGEERSSIFPHSSFSVPQLLGWLALLAGLGGILLLGAIWLAPEPWIAQTAKLLDRSQLAQWAFGGSPTLFVSYQWANFLHLALALVAAGLAILIVVNARNSTASNEKILSFPQILVLSVILLDLLLAARTFMPHTPVEVAKFTPPSIEWLATQHEPGTWRYTSLEKDWKILNANASMQYGLEDIRGYDSIILKHYVNLMEAVAPQRQLDFNRIAPLSAYDPPPDQELLDLLNVRYLVTDQAIDWASWQHVYDDEVQIYENQDVMPRAFLLGNALYSGPREEMIPAEALHTLEPRQTVILQGDEGDILENGEPSSDLPFTPVEITSYTPNEITMRIDPSKPAWLVFSEVDFPGWRAFVRPAGTEEGEEQELEVVRANGAFRAVRVEPGEQVVRWKYSPNSVKIGFFGSFLGVAALGLAGAYWAW
ncbi:MAG: hypothetical protein M3220_21915, partial [Chloroflexota bacterium]|nr:hypothetical protein [Chloroflexota bacterium]